MLATSPRVFFFLLLLLLFAASFEQKALVGVAGGRLRARLYLPGK